MARYILEVRDQPRYRNSLGFYGPDTYVAVQIVPDGVEPLLEVLDPHEAAKRGIEIRRFGDGYSYSDGPRSRLAKAIDRAEHFIAEMNTRRDP